MDGAEQVSCQELLVMGAGTGIRRAKPPASRGPGAVSQGRKLAGREEQGAGSSWRETLGTHTRCPIMVPLHCLELVPVGACVWPPATPGSDRWLATGGGCAGKEHEALGPGWAGSACQALRSRVSL